LKTQEFVHYDCALGKAEVTGSIPVASSNDVSVRTL